MSEPADITVEQQQEKWKSCDDRYVRNDHFWRWIAGGVGGSILLIGTTIFTLTKWGAAMEQEDAIARVRITQVEITQDKLSTVIHNQDTLKVLIRGLKK